mgnify:CR=1 FL=1
MEITAQIALVTIPVPHFRLYDQVTVEEVSFRIYRNGDCFKAIPQTVNADYKLSGLPKELWFVYTNYVVLEANNTDDETLNVIKKIILELQVQDLL